MFGLGAKASDNTNTVPVKEAATAPVGGSTASSAATWDMNAQASNASSTPSTTDTAPKPAESVSDNTKTSDPIVQPADGDAAPAGAIDTAEAAMGTDVSFEDFVHQKIGEFLGVMDIEDVTERREALIGVCPTESEILERLAIARAFLVLWTVYSNHIGDEGMIENARSLAENIKAIKLWLGI